jgi:nucleotide-binding universal stress UspA family protein
LNDREVEVAASRTIAVGYDGSPDSEAAVRWAAELAVSVGAQLVVVHAVGLLEGADISLARPDGTVALGIASSVGMEPACTQWLVLDGDPCSVMLRVANPPTSADLLVVGTTGIGKHAGTTLGSASLELAETSEVPLAIVPMGKAGPAALA